MAKSKKVRRARRSAPPERVEGKGRVRKTRDSAEKLSPEEAFREQYAYVIKDLRRVFMIAGAMFVLLIALNLLLQ